MDYRYNQNRHAGGSQRSIGGRQQVPGISGPSPRNGPMGRNMVGGEAVPPSIPPMYGYPMAGGELPAPQPQTFTPVDSQADADASPSKGFSLASLGSNIKDLQGVIDRLGGLDGILSTVQKVQKVVSTFQQMAPLIKALIPFGSKKKKSADDELDLYRPKKKRRRKTSKRRKRRPRR